MEKTLGKDYAIPGFAGEDCGSRLLQIVLMRPGGKLVWACGSYGPEGEGGSRVLAGAMRAAGFVDVKIDVTRLQGAARWTPVVGLKPR